MSGGKRFLSIAAAARRVDRDESTIRRWIDRGLMFSGGLIPEPELLEFERKMRASRGRPRRQPDAKAVQRLRNAIAKLEQLKETTTPGPWAPWTSVSTDDEGDRVYVTGNGSGPSEGNVVAEFVYEDRSDDVLTATLHRTIDAQLRVLAYGATVVGDIPEAVMELADAILGGES